MSRLNKRTKGHGIGKSGKISEHEPQTLKKSSQMFKNMMAAENISNVYEHLIRDANQRQ